MVLEVPPTGCQGSPSLPGGHNRKSEVLQTEPGLLRTGVVPYEDQVHPKGSHPLPGD